MRAMLREGFRRLLAPEAPRHARGRKNAFIIAVASQKGGVGKTTTAVAVGAALAKFHGLSTLIIDLDAQGHVHRSLEKHVVGRAGRLSDVLVSGQRGEVLDVVADTGIERLQITCGDRTLADAESIMATKIGKELLLRDALVATRTHYDAIVIDCPPNLGNLTINALAAADWVLVPCDPSPLAVQGVNDILGALGTIHDRLNPNLDLLGIALTRVDRRNTTLNAAMEEQLRVDYGDLVCAAKIGVCASLAKAQFHGTCLFNFDRESRASQQYLALATELLARIKGEGQNSLAWSA